MAKSLIVLNQADVEFPNQDYDFVVGVDGGCRWCIKNEIKMDLAIGDFDSLEENYLAYLSQHAASVKPHPTDKDLTDLELAIDSVVNKNPIEITVLGAWGGRTDHCLNNLFCLAKQTEQVPVKLPGELQNGYLLKSRQVLRLKSKNQQLVSLMAMFSDCSGVTNKGMKYPLNDATIAVGTGHGISNLTTDNTSEIYLSKGVLLVLIDSSIKAEIQVLS